VTNKPTRADHRRASDRQTFPADIGRKAQRKLRARKDHGMIFWLGMFGLVGWSVAIPTLAGTALGLWLDRHWPADFSWTLTGLFCGLMLGCINAWYWLKQERDNSTQKDDDHDGAH
jgi:ATP synthase protein I